MLILEHRGEKYSYVTGEAFKLKFVSILLMNKLFQEQEVESRAKFSSFTVGFKPVSSHYI